MGVVWEWYGKLPKSRVFVFFEIFFVTTFSWEAHPQLSTTCPGEQCEEICSHWFDLCLGRHLWDGKCELHRLFDIYGALAIQADHHRDDDLAVGRKGTKHDAVVHSFYNLIWDAWICLGGEGQRRLEWRFWQKENKNTSLKINILNPKMEVWFRWFPFYQTGDVQVPCWIFSKVYMIQ